MLSGSMLNKRVDGNDKKAACKPECGKQKQYIGKRQTVSGNGETENRHTDRAKRDQSILDLSARQIARCKTSQTDADRQRRLKIAAVSLVKPENLSAVEHDHKLEQRSQKPEISIARNGQMQSSVAASKTQVPP